MGKHTLGDVLIRLFQEIWYGAFQRVHRNLYTGRKNIGLCRYCDFLQEPKAHLKMKEYCWNGLYIMRMGLKFVMTNISIKHFCVIRVK